MKRGIERKGLTVSYSLKKRLEKYASDWYTSLSSTVIFLLKKLISELSEEELKNLVEKKLLETKRKRRQEGTAMLVANVNEEIKETINSLAEEFVEYTSVIAEILLNEALERTLKNEERKG